MSLETNLCMMWLFHGSPATDRLPKMQPSVRGDLRLIFEQPRFTISFLAASPLF
jgi:hypothetical protein